MAATPMATEDLRRSPAKTYAFPLDGFQAKAIECIDRGESVLVSAHTSAGKTVCAEYAIAKALCERARVVYTSPIKALSNQKYRDLYEEFEDVGLMTGDVTIRPDASCIVMTTEVLRSMLYRGSELVREVRWVVYDEIHYLGDRERGVVWEESIILLPRTVRFVFLSATIPNSAEFASWIATTHRQPCHVVHTDARPTPLVHYVFAGGPGGARMHIIADEDAAVEAASLPPPPHDALERVVELLVGGGLTPAIVFSFERRRCEANAAAFDDLALNSAAERALVAEAYESAMDVVDERLPQLTALLPTLVRGVGIHHGGLLPIVREVVEMLFEEGLLKVLFATETFAIGLNMPARSVVFTATRKYDGTGVRTVSKAEFSQMAGRAGRRGKDVRGTVIVIDGDGADLRDLIYGDVEPLESAYRVTYGMLLNMTRLGTAAPDDVLRHSFFQHQRRAEAVDDREHVLSDDLVRMSGALVRLGYVCADGGVSLKGTMACRINAADALVVVEILSDDVFAALEPSAIAAILSCMVFNVRWQGDPVPPTTRKDLVAPLEMLQAAARRVARATRAAASAEEVDDYVANFNPGMMDVVIEWSRGSKFADVLKTTSDFEGNVVRVLRRLDELLRQAASAASLLAEPCLRRKVEEASALVGRGVVRDCSLYAATPVRG